MVKTFEIVCYHTVKIYTYKETEKTGQCLQTGTRLKLLTTRDFKIASALFMLLTQRNSIQIIFNSSNCKKIRQHMSVELEKKIHFKDNDMI